MGSWQCPKEIKKEVDEINLFTENDLHSSSLSTEERGSVIKDAQKMSLLVMSPKQKPI